MPSQPTPKSPATVRLAGLTRFPVEADASRRDAQRVVNENLRAAERFALTGASLSPDGAIAAIEAGLAMVPQPAQQQQTLAYDPLCPVMDAAYFERMAQKMADPAWPNIEPFIARAEQEIRASAARYAAEQKAVAGRVGITEPLVLAGRYGKAA